MSYTIHLPWPRKALSPNARVHWRTKAPFVKAARAEAAWWAVIAFAGQKPAWARVAVSVIFFPPDNRRRDLDNLIASLKPTMDGIAEAIGIDDAKFVPTYSIGDPVPMGRVSVSLSEALELTR